MPQIDAGNPYQAPEASTVPFRAEMARPPVYTAISLFCWAVGAFHLVGSLILLGIVIRNSLKRGWLGAFGPGNDRLGPLILGLGIMATTSYLAAGRSLRDNQGRPGLILCVAGIGMTYLIIWLGGRS